MKKFTWKNTKFIFKGQIDIKDVGIENVLVSNKYSIVKSCFKYFIGYVNNFLDDVKPLLNKLNGSVKGFEKGKYMPFMLEGLLASSTSKRGNMRSKIKTIEILITEDLIDSDLSSDSGFDSEDPSNYEVINC